MEPGMILEKNGHTNQRSKVVVMKNGELLELRRGDLTFTAITKKTIQPRIWKTVEDWQTSISEDTEAVKEREAKRSRSGSYDTTPIELAHPLEESAHPLEESAHPPDAPQKLRRATDSDWDNEIFFSDPTRKNLWVEWGNESPFPNYELKNRWVERLKKSMIADLRKDIDTFVVDWITKFKLE